MQAAISSPIRNARARPTSESARWPQAGTTNVDASAPRAAASPIVAGSRPRAWRITGTNGAIAADESPIAV